MTTQTEAIAPGLLVLHGNRLEDLAATVMAWLAQHPLEPLEQETLLVQSNGMAEWLKIEVALAHGICAAARVELPARFLWRTYRAVLGRDAVAPQSPLDKHPLTWRLMALLPELQQHAVFAPVAGFLAGGDPARRLQLAQRLADLFDQYQVYRSDWLNDWASGHDLLRSASGATTIVPADQVWQPALWRALLDTLDVEQVAAARPQLHERFLKALGSPTAPAVPRRIVLFGTTHVPRQTLEAVAALSRHSQVLLAVPNPCRYHWADLIDGRELLRATRRRQALRGVDLAELPLESLHAHGHPLLAAWGRQSRDFVRQLDAFDDAEAARGRFALPRIDFFDESPGETLLQQVQARIRDLVPLAEHPAVELAREDHSIVFHVAHGAQREVEILHDQLLELLGHPPGGRPLAPREIVVMVPDIDTFAPAIRSVFGQHGRGHARHIPWGIADLRERRHKPLLIALDWMLRAPAQRCTATELLGLLEVPAVARRWVLRDEDLPPLSNWIAQAGVRWGLDGQHRAALQLEACGDTNTWAFGLRRMLLGYATGAFSVDADSDGDIDSDFDNDGFAGIEPCSEVAGLAAGLAGTLAELLDALQTWWRDAACPRTPGAWGERLRELLGTLFAASDESERATLAALDDALTGWLQACDDAGFEEEVDLAVVREAWLDAVDEPGLSQRFRAGGVTFCTLLPLRAIPFEVVCLLGMNDGDYPRRTLRSDFDLMGLAGQARPGDRSRRDDDRQLMLDALLSARRVLYVSWAGRSQRDNQAQPPSVLVAQLRDYLATAWGEQGLRERTIDHPLQPFSRAYFEGRERLFTHALEWRAAFDVRAAGAPAPASTNDEGADGEPPPLTIDELARFLRNPVKSFFRNRLQVVFDEPESGPEDDEPFESVGLERWQQIDDVLRDARRWWSDRTEDADDGRLPQFVRAQVARLSREGRLPLAAPGAAASTALELTLQPMLAQWMADLRGHPHRHDKRPLRLAHPARPGLRLEHWLTELRTADTASEGDGVAATAIELRASKLAGKATRQGRPPQPDKLLSTWLVLLAAAALGEPIRMVLIGSDARISLRLQEGQEQAHQALQTLLSLMDAWAEQKFADTPLPAALRTGLAWLDDPDGARAVFEGSFDRKGEADDECLARVFPDFEALSTAPGFEATIKRLYAPFQAWLQSGCVEVIDLPGAVDAASDED